MNVKPLSDEPASYNLKFFNYLPVTFLVTDPLVPYQGKGMETCRVHHAALGFCGIFKHPYAFFHVTGHVSGILTYPGGNLNH